MKTIQLTPNQISAFECRDGGWDDENLVSRCFTGTALVVADDDIDALTDEVLDACNAEDAAAEAGDAFARKAAVGLSAVHSKLLDI